MINHTPTRQTQDWQIESMEYKYKHNPISRHKHVIDEMDSGMTRWGINMSKRGGR